jgi:hypothetical protein
MFYNFNHLTVNPSNAMLCQQTHLMYDTRTAQHNTTQHTDTIQQLTRNQRRCI